MQRIVKKESQAGFAVIELVLIVVVLAVIAGAGVFFIHNRQANTSSASEANTAVPKAQPGTTAAIDQLTQRDAESEASIDKNADAAAQQNATSANGDLTSLGGAYNEASF